MPAQYPHGGGACSPVVVRVMKQEPAASKGKAFKSARGMSVCQSVRSYRGLSPLGAHARSDSSEASSTVHRGPNTHGGLVLTQPKKGDELLAMCYTGPPPPLLMELTIYSKQASKQRPSVLIINQRVQQTRSQNVAPSGCSLTSTTTPPSPHLKALISCARRENGQIGYGI